MSVFPRIYQSFSDFERDELRKLDTLNASVGELLEERFSEELGMVEAEQKARRRSRR